ncbi:MAG TPA: FtsX-like permease family protein [Acidimicrobiales bacterium]
MWRVVLYRFRATFARRWGGLLAIVVLIGLVGGLALGVLAGARRTQSAYPAFLKSTNPSDLSIVGAPPSSTGTLLGSIARLPGVKHVESYAVPVAGPIAADGAPTPAALNEIPLASIDGLGFDQDRLTAVQGRVANPARADEVDVTLPAARALRVHPGDTLAIGVFTAAQTQLPAFGTARVQPREKIKVTVVGVVEFSNNIVQDDVDANGEGGGSIIFTPAFTRPITRCCNTDLFSGFQVNGGSRAVSAVEGEIERAMPKNSAYYVHVTSVFEAQAERAIKPEAIALGVFGGIAALAALLIAAQVIARQLRLDDEDLETLRAIGASPSMTVCEGLIGPIGAVVAGSLLAASVAVGLSPLAPIGPARAVYPSRGVAFDWTVIGSGFAGLIVILSAVAILFAWRRTPDRARRHARTGIRGSKVARGAAAAGAPPATVVGIRFAFESGRGRNAAPVRSAMLGAVLAIAAVAGTLTFGTSLHTLVSHPALYGWNWNDEILTKGGGGDIPLPTAQALLDHDHDVSAWSGVYFDSLRIDGQTVPIMGTQPGATVQPPILSGHGLEATDQIVLGGTSLAQLHKRVGDTVEASYGDAPPTVLHVVGTATMPAVGPAEQLHLSMGTGALVAYQQLPYQVRNSGETHAPDHAFAPNAIFVRLRKGANPALALATLRRMVAAKTSEVSVQSVQRPAEIVNYRSMGSTPSILGAALAAAAFSALMLTLMASVRRRRHDLALLKTLGFTRGQLAAVVAWQSTIAVGVGVVVGVPIGIVAGRELWNLFAHELHVVAEPSVPALTLALIAVGAIALANLIAAVPGLQAARTPSALVLHEA